MKKRFLHLTLLSFLSISLSYGQLSDIGKFFAGGPEDAEKLMEGYLSPYFNAFGTSMTGGWYNTAKPHQLGGFDITATFNTAIVPGAHRNFNIEELDLQTLNVHSTETRVTSPTIAGEKNMGPLMSYNLDDIDSPVNPGEIQAFEMPKGTGFPYIPSPMLQAGLGLIKDTEINGRYMPTFKSGDTEIGMWGIGFKHGLKQWIPFIKKVPVLHVTLQYGYTKMDARAGLNVTPESINAADQTTTADWDNQRMEFVTNSHTGNLLISANLPVVCFYGGIGFASTKTILNLRGDFPVVDPMSLTSGGFAVTDGSYLNDPISMEVKNSDGSITKPRYNIGMRFKFAVITLHFDYTYATYSMATGGIGISFR